MAASVKAKTVVYMASAVIAGGITKILYDQGRLPFASDVSLGGGSDGDYSTGDLQGRVSMDGSLGTISSGVNPYYPEGQDLLTGRSNTESTATSSSGGNFANFEMGNKETCYDEDCPPNHTATTRTDGKGDQTCACVPTLKDANLPEKRGFFAWLFGG